VAIVTYAAPQLGAGLDPGQPPRGDHRCARPVGGWGHTTQWRDGHPAAYGVAKANFAPWWH